MAMESRKSGRNVPQSGEVSVRQFLQSWNLDALEAVRLRPMSMSTKEGEESSLIAKRMGVDEETVKELADVCSPENLLWGDEPETRKELLQMRNAENIPLDSVKYQMEQVRLRDTSNNFKFAVQKHVKYSHLDEYTFVRPLEESMSDNIPEDVRVTIPNVILSVQISKCRLRKANYTKVRPRETFFVLGTQNLSDLRDAIKCPLDELIAGDYSCIPDTDPETILKAKDIYKSGFFFIENVFYNDLRLADNKDYSKPILEWAKVNLPGTEMSVSDMATTTFLDLTIKLGCYYLFTHQGNCEHSILFQDIRLFTSEDAQDLRLYPLQIAERMKARRHCQGCSKISATWVVFDSPLTPTDPCFFCQICFKTFLYTKDGQKISNFKAHHYADYCF